MNVASPIFDKNSTPKKRGGARKATAPRIVGPMTYEEYAAFDRAAERKHQLIDGKVIEVAGASHEHNLLSSTTLRLLGNSIDAANLPYDVFGSDQAVYANRRNALYPDITIAPRAAQLDERDRLSNPVVIVEVLSDSTRAYDSDKKFKAHQTIPSFRHYILISQDEIFVKHFARNADGVWVIVGMYSERTDHLTITLNDAAITLSAEDLYRRVAFAE